MTDIQKAIKFAENEIKSLELAPKINGCEMTEWWKEQIEVWETAISAIEKQIPKKPTYEEIGNVYGALKRTCAKCGDVCLISEDAKPFEHYCRYCGQKIDWSDAE